MSLAVFKPGRGALFIYINIFFLRFIDKLWAPATVGLFWAFVSSIVMLSPVTLTACDGAAEKNTCLSPPKFLSPSFTSTNPLASTPPSQYTIELVVAAQCRIQIMMVR